MSAAGGAQLPLHPPGSYVGAVRDGVFWFAVATVAGCFGFLVWLAVEDPVLGAAAIAGVPASWVLRRAYQWLPTAQQVTTVLTPDDRVRVVAGRGAIRPLARLLSRGRPERRGPAIAIGVVIGAAVPVLLAVVAVVLDLRWLPLVLVSAIVWLLVELILRIALVNRALARGARLGQDAVGGYVAIWQLERGSSWRRGVPREELVALVATRPELRRLARDLTRPLLEVSR